MDWVFYFMTQLGGEMGTEMDESHVLLRTWQ